MQPRPQLPALQRQTSSPSSPFAGFLLDRAGTSVRGSDPRVQIIPTGINDRGEIVGEYIIATRKQSGFLRDRRGRITSFDVPGAREPRPSDLNDRGQIVGTYSEDTPIVNKAPGRARSFLIALVAEFTRIDFPGRS